jgi:tellurium resistance protein TerD
VEDTVAGGVSLTKGGNVSLTKEAPNLTAVTVGLGWQARSTTGADFDLDASALVTGVNGKVLSDQHFVFFNNLKSPDGTVEHMGDELVGGTAGAEQDEEEVKVDLALMAPEVQKIVFPVSIYDAEARHQNFGQVTGAYIRIINQADGRELARYDLTEDASTETAMVFGELYRHGGEWKFRAIGQGYASGLRGIALDYGVNV